MSDESFPCPYCQVGYCQPGKGTYLRIVGNMLVSVPDMPAWTCDVCNYQEFDRESVLRLEMLLGQTDDLVSDAARMTTKTQPVEAPESRTPRRVKT